MIPWSEKNYQKKKNAMVWTSIETLQRNISQSSIQGAKKINTKRGGQKLTWLKIIENYLKDVKVKVKVVNRDGGGNTENEYQVYNHEDLAKNRQIWQVVVNLAMSMDEQA